MAQYERERGARQGEHDPGCHGREARRARNGAHEWDKLPLFADEPSIGAAVLGPRRACEWTALAALYERQGLPKIDEVIGGRHVPAATAVKFRYPLKAVKLSIFANDLALLRQRCERLQAEMLLWLCDQREQKTKKFKPVAPDMPRKWRDLSRERGYGFDLMATALVTGKTLTAIGNLLSKGT